MAAPVEGKHAFGHSVIKDGVGIFADIFHPGDELKRFQIEDADGTVFAVAGKSKVEFRSESDAVNARRLGDLAHRLAGIGVDHDDVTGAGDEKAAGVGIELEVVPTTLAANFVGLDYMKAWIGSK